MSALTINLLPKEQKKVADKLLYFILHYFRYIIVITQIVVIAVFFYRFQRDQEIIDLKESFRQKQQILAITLPIIEEAEAIEKKTNHVSTLLSTDEVLLEHLDFIVSVIPQDTILNSIDIKAGSIQLVGNSQRILSIRSLHKRIKRQEQYSTVKITNVTVNDDGSYSFGLAIPVMQPKK